MGLTCSRISAWGVGEAATFSVTVSAVSPLSVSSVVSVVSELPQAVRDADRARARIRLKNFLFIFISSIE